MLWRVCAADAVVRAGVLKSKSSYEASCSRTDRRKLRAAFFKSRSSQTYCSSALENGTPYCSMKPLKQVLVVSGKERRICFYFLLGCRKSQLVILACLFVQASLAVDLVRNLVREVAEMLCQQVAQFLVFHAGVNSMIRKLFAYLDHGTGPAQCFSWVSRL